MNTYTIAVDFATARFVASAAIDDERTVFLYCSEGHVQLHVPSEDGD